VSVADSGQRLYAKKETVVKPFSASSAGDASSVDSVKRGKQQVERDVKGGDYRGKLRPTQSKQPLINVSPLPTANVDFNKLDLAGMDGNAMVPLFRYLLLHPL
jgi:hypothetical protein